MFPSLLVLRHGDSKLNFKIVMIALMPHSSDVIYGLKLLSIHDKGSDRIYVQGGTGDF